MPRRVTVALIVFCLLIASSSYANLKKGSIGSGKSKEFSFSSSSDGPCTATVIYDRTSSDIDAGIASATTGDLICFGISGQTNFESCTAGLPPGDFVLVISSFKGSSSFRAVVNCANQQSVTAGGVSSSPVLREIDLGMNGQRIVDQLRRVGSRVKGSNP
jgi:hypothetical protein